MMTATIAKAEKDRRKVTAAILAAVNALVEEEQAATGKPAMRRRPAQVSSLWPLMGREEIMRMRAMWQRRMV